MLQCCKYKMWTFSVEIDAINNKSHPIEVAFV